MAHANGARPMPVIWSAAELLALELPEPRWAVPGLVPEGVTILAGRPKLGKSWLGLGLAIAVASGGRALGSIELDAGDALYLGLEDSAKRLQQRLVTMLDGRKAPARLSVTRDWPKGGHEQLGEWLEAHPHARLVVLDTLARFRAPARGRDRGYSDDYADLEPLQQLASQRQVAIIVVHHIRKLAADDWIDTITGTLGLAGAADALLGLFRARGEAQAVLKVTGRDLEEQELGLRFDPHGGTWAMLGEAATTVGLSPERREILDVLGRRSRPANAREVADVVGKSHDATRKLLQRMRAERIVSQSPDGWSLVRARESPMSHLSHPTTPTDGTHGTDGTRKTHGTGETHIYKEEGRLFEVVP